MVDFRSADSEFEPCSGSFFYFQHSDQKLGVTIGKISGKSRHFSLLEAKRKKNKMTMQEICWQQIGFHLLSHKTYFPK